MKVAVIIPCKNEPYEPVLKRRINSALKAIPHAIYVQYEKGLSKAVIAGVKKALFENADVIVIMDGDGSHDPTYLNGMIRLTQKNDIVVGSRYLSEGCTHDSKLKTVISKTTCRLVALLLGVSVKDSTSGFVVTKAVVFRSLLPSLHPIGFKFLLELLVKAKIYSVAEYPIVFGRRKMGYSKNNLVQAFITFAFMVKLLVWRYSHSN